MKTIQALMTLSLILAAQSARANELSCVATFSAHVDFDSSVDQDFRFDPTLMYGYVAQALAAKGYLLSTNDPFVEPDYHIDLRFGLSQYDTKVKNRDREWKNDNSDGGATISATKLGIKFVGGFEDNSSSRTKKEYNKQSILEFTTSIRASMRVNTVSNWGGQYAAFGGGSEKASTQTTLKSVYDSKDSNNTQGGLGINLTVIPIPFFPYGKAGIHGDNAAKGRLDIKERRQVSVKDRNFWVPTIAKVIQGLPTCDSVQALRRGGVQSASMPATQDDATRSDDQSSGHL